MARTVDGEVLGRGEELERLTEFVDRVDGGAAGLVLDGEAGIGKTELWRFAVSAARARGYLVFEARPSEVERELSFAGLADLFSRVHEEIAALPAPQRRPLAVALLLEEAGGATSDARAIAVATLELLRRLSRTGPLLVAIDDTQWLDRASSAALAFALRRAATEPIRALLARRSGELSPFELDRSIPQDRIEVGPMSLGAIHFLLRERLGATFSRSTLRRIHDRAGGNPFFALELGRALQARGGVLAPGDELPVPDDLGRLLRDRLATLPPETAEPLAALAALGERPLRLVVEDAALESAFEAGVLVLDGQRVRFAHPLLAAAAYERLTPSRRRTMHRRLAEVVEESEQAARHLALAADGPDPKLAALLEEAAVEAHARGAVDAAVELAERALVLDDRVDSDASARRVAAAAQYQILSGDFRRARGLLEGALATAPAGPTRARLLRVLAQSSDDIDTQRSLLETALEESRGEARLEAEILVELGFLIGAARRIADAEPYLRAAVEAAEGIGDPALLAAAISVLATNEFFTGQGLNRELMDRALALEPHCTSLPIGSRPVTRFGLMAKWAGDIDRSRELLYEACRIGEERGDSGVYEPLYYTCFLEFLRDDWHRGLELANRICEEGAELERDEHLFYGLIARGVFLAHLGDETGARRDAEALLPLGESLRSTHGIKFCGHALGTLDLSLDRPAEALASARAATASDRDEGVEEPASHLSFSIHVEAAIALGELAEAEELVGWIEERAVRLDREAVLAVAARCRGLLAAARGDEPGAVAAFERALAEHERVQHRRFELARTLLAQGETLRRFKRRRAAREAIEAAAAVFDELGAALWSAKARRGLARISGRRSADGLTETERRVAELVTSGLSTKQVAAALVVSPKTVEGHLSSIYAKLGVHSRTQLAHRLTADKAG